MADSSFEILSIKDVSFMCFELLKAACENKLELVTDYITKIVNNEHNYLLGTKKTKKGYTILMLCIKRKWINLALILIHLDILNNICNNDGNSPLIFATMYNCELLIEPLLSCNTLKINHQNNVGISAFIWACHNNNINIINTLIIAECDITLTNREGHDGLLWLIENNNTLLSLHLIQLHPQIFNVYIKVSLACKYKMNDVAIELIKNIKTRENIKYSSIEMLIQKANENEMYNITNELTTILASKVV